MLHGQSLAVRGVDEAPQPVRAPVAALGGEREDAVVAPVTRARKFRARHELDRGHAEIAWLKQVAFDGTSVSPLELAAAVELIAYFDGIVLERQSRAGFADGATRSAKARCRPAAVTPQTVAIPGASGNPFEILHIGEDASDDDVRAAYKRLMKLNHPDKVSHMSDEIQAYAHAQVRVIKAAYDAITTARGS